MYGKHHTEKFKHQMSEAWMGDKNPMKNPKISKKQVETRRANDPEGRRFQKTWEERRRLYGPTGRKPK